MKLRILFIALLLLALAAGAAASTADAIIVAPETLKITAPYNATLLPFDLKAGDSVSANDVLFSIQTTPIYAAQGGKVVSVYAAPGDDAAGIMNRYHALAVIEPTYPLYIDADTSQAYDKDENKYIHAGELLYLKCGNDKGQGRVTAVNGSHYTVEILLGSFDLDDSVRCYRESGHANDSEVGRGKVTRYPDIVVSAEGRIKAVNIKAGDTVKTGDLIFEILDPLAAPDAGGTITAPASGVLSALHVLSGQQVYRGQLLCEITNLSTLELSCELDEMDLPGIHVGDSLSYTLDAYPDRTVSGTVLRIYPLGTVKQNATYYDVRLTVPSDLQLYPGMNATVKIQ